MQNSFLKMKISDSLLLPLSWYKYDIETIGRGYFMSNNEFEELEKLVVKLQQHEEIITQLVEIIGATNRQVFELTNNQQDQQHLYMLN